MYLKKTGKNNLLPNVISANVMINIKNDNYQTFIIPNYCSAPSGQGYLAVSSTFQILNHQSLTKTGKGAK